MKVSPSDENGDRQGIGHGYKGPVQSAMQPSSSHPLTAASRTRAPNNVRNENSDPPSHKDDQTPLSNENEDEDEGFSEFIACLGAEDDAKTDQWQCSTCSFINKNPLHLTCDICGTVRKGRESEDRIIKEQIEKHLMPYDSKGMGIENCPDEEDAPIPAAQIAARYESMEETAKKPAIIDDGDSPPLLPWQIGCEGEDLVAKKSYATSSTPLSACQTSTSNNPPSTSDEDVEQNMPNSGQPQVEIIIHRPPPPSMLPRQSDDEEEEPSADLPSLPQIEATAVDDVVYDAIAVQSDANREGSGAQEENADKTNINQDASSWWKRNRKYLLVGVIALVIGGLIATVATLVGSKDDINIVVPVPDPVQSTSSTAPSVVSLDDSIDKTMQSTPPTTAPSETDNLHYYADRGNNRCFMNKLGPDNSTVQQQMRRFQTLKECCEAE